MLRHSSAHLLAEAVRRLYPGVKIAIGPPIENGFYYDFEFPEPIVEDDLGRIEEEINRELAEGRSWERQRDRPRRGAVAVRAGGRAVQGRARRHGRRADLALHAGRLHRPLPRPAPPELEADQGAQAHRPRRRVLARRREEPTADAHLRDGLLLAGRSRPPSGAAGGGQEARPPPARPAARPLPLLGARTRHAALASKGGRPLERAGAAAFAGEPEARLRRGAHAAHVGRGHVLDLGPLPQVRGPDVQGGRARPAVRAEVDELPGPHASVRKPAAQLQGAAAALFGGCLAPPRRAARNAARPAARPHRHARTTRTSSAPKSRSRTRSRAVSSRPATCTSCSA